MRSKNRKWKILASIVGILAVLLVAGPIVSWKTLTYQPTFYRQRVVVSEEKRREVADRFESRSLQLRNDIANEDHWEAMFGDDEVNAWLEARLRTHFGSLIPAELSDPVVVFERDRIRFACKVKRGQFPMLIWGVAEVEVVQDHLVSVTIDKLQAGAIPVPLDKLKGRIASALARLGSKLTWFDLSGQTVALIDYKDLVGTEGLVLDQIQFLEGQVYLSGHSGQEEDLLSETSVPTQRTR